MTVLIALIHSSQKFSINHTHQSTSIDDLSLAQIRIFLQEIKSDLFHSALTIPFKELVRLMQIARGPDEYLKPVNAGLLFFSEQPEKYFPYSWIEVNIFHDDIGDSFSEKVFKGPMQQQLKEALAYIKSLVIEDHVRKVDYQAEAIRFYNYPVQAIANATSEYLKCWFFLNYYHHTKPCFW